MKKITVLVVFIFSAIVSVKAQCPNSNFKDIADWLNAKPAPNTQNFVLVQWTLINAAVADGTHFFTTYGSGQLRTFSDQPCNIGSVGTVDFLFSDRTVSCNGGNQLFAQNRQDVSDFFINTATNTIANKSQTWNFTATYTNCRRTGNMIYAFSGANMLIMNIHKGNSPVIL